MNDICKHYAFNGTAAARAYTSLPAQFERSRVNFNARATYYSSSRRVPSPPTLLSKRDNAPIVFTTARAWFAVWDSWVTPTPSRSANHIHTPSRALVRTEILNYKSWQKFIFFFSFYCWLLQPSSTNLLAHTKRKENNTMFCLLHTSQRALSKTRIYIHTHTLQYIINIYKSFCVMWNFVFAYNVTVFGAHGILLLLYFLFMLISTRYNQRIFVLPRAKINNNLLEFVE